MNRQPWYNLHVKRNLPDYDLPFPEYNQNKDAVVIFSLFQAFLGVVPHYHINSAFWVMHSMFVNSNLREMGIPIVFYVENKLWNLSEVRDRFKKANISESQIMLFDQMEADEITRKRLGMKLQTVNDDRFDAYDTCFLWDTDNFVCTSKDGELDFGMMMKSDRKDLFGSIMVSFQGATSIYDRVWWQDRFEYDESTGEDKPEYREKWEKDVVDMTGKTVQEMEDFYDIGGQLYRWYPRHLDPEFKKWLIKSIPMIADDEFIVAMWIRAFDGEVSNIGEETGLVMFHKKEDWERRHDYDCYFDHIWLERTEFDGKPIPGYEVPEIRDIWWNDAGMSKRVTEEPSQIFPSVFTVRRS